MTAPSRLLPALILLLLAGPSLAHETEEHKLLASDGAAGHRFGRSVSLRGADFLVGAPGHGFLGANAGAAYVFSQSGSSFSETAQLFAPDGAAGDEFGRAVALGDDIAVVGAYLADAGATNSGAVYVFTRSGGVWTPEAKLVPDVPVAEGRFGHSVAIDGDRVLVGAPGAAAAYLFRRGGGSGTKAMLLWAQEWVMTSSFVPPSSLFGTAVALDSDVAAVGAQQHDGAGSVFVFRESGGAWAEEQEIVGSVRNAGDGFGASLALGGPGLLVVGAPGDDDQALDAGASYRFRHQGGQWTEEAKRLGLDAGDGAGNAVSISFNYELVGSRYFDLPGFNKAGAALLWKQTEADLEQSFVASDPATRNFLGGSVTIDGCTIVTGSVGDDSLGSNAGAVYVFAVARGAVYAYNGSAMNPQGMRSLTDPNLGQSWVVEFDTSVAPGADTTILLVRARWASSAVVIPAGELLVDLASARYMQRMQAGSGLVSQSVLLPKDPWLLGAQACAQGFLRDSITGELTALNGEFLVIGCEGGHQP